MVEEGGNAGHVANVGGLEVDGGEVEAEISRVSGLVDSVVAWASVRVVVERL